MCQQFLYTRSRSPSEIVLPDSPRILGACFAAICFKIFSFFQFRLLLRQIALRMQKQ
jgi:hypothetical protein